MAHKSSRWIPVTEATPPLANGYFSEPVLIYARGKNDLWFIGIGYYVAPSRLMPATWRMFEVEGVVKVTHWRWLPGPPRDAIKNVYEEEQEDKLDNVAKYVKEKIAKKADAMKRLTRNKKYIYDEK